MSMSRYLGKLLLQKKWTNKPGQCLLKYKKNSNAFIFKIDGEAFRIAHDLLFKILCDTIEPVYKWSTGYKTKELEDDLDKVYENEIEQLGGRYYLIAETDQLDSDYTYYMLSVAQYVFNFSWTRCIDAKREQKRVKWGRSSSKGWINIPTRDPESYRGRKAGAKAKEVNDDSVQETDEQFQERYEHNIEWAIDKRYFWAYEEAEKERILRSGQKYNKGKKQEVLKKWIEITEQDE